MIRSGLPLLPKAGSVVGVPVAGRRAGEGLTHDGVGAGERGDGGEGGGELPRAEDRVVAQVQGQRDRLPEEDVLELALVVERDGRVRRVARGAAGDPAGRAVLLCRLLP